MVSVGLIWLYQWFMMVNHGNIWNFSRNGGYPKKWMVYFMEHPIKLDDDWGYPHDSGNLHLRVD